MTGATTDWKPPPDAGEAPGKGPHRNQLDPDRTVVRLHRSPTVAYIEGRERVLGRRLHLHREPIIAARLLVEELGTLGARAWAREVTQQVGL